MHTFISDPFFKGQTVLFCEKFGPGGPNFLGPKFRWEPYDHLLVGVHTFTVRLGGNFVLTSVSLGLIGFHFSEVKNVLVLC